MIIDGRHANCIFSPNPVAKLIIDHMGWDTDHCVKACENLSMWEA